MWRLRKNKMKAFINMLRTMYNWNCSKCNTTIQKDSKPSSFGCSAGGLHNWHRL